jgi:hypothetical protein
MQGTSNQKLQLKFSLIAAQAQRTPPHPEV